MSVSNPAGLVTSSTGGLLEGPIHQNDTAVPSPQASSQGGSSNAPEPSVLPLYPTPHPSGCARSLATSPLDVNSRPGLEDPPSKDGDRALSHPATAISSTSQGRPSSPGSAGGPRSNAFSNQALEHYPPSSSPRAPATPTTVAASLRKALTDPSPSSTLGTSGVAAPSSPTPVSIHSDASTFTTSFTTYDKISPTNGGSVSPRPRSPTLASGPSVAHLSSLFSAPSHSNSSSPRGRLPPLVTSPTSDEPPSPLAPTPPPKSPRTLAFGNSSSSSRSALPPAFMGSSQSKPAASAVSRSQPSSSGQRLQKAPPAQQSNQHAPSSATSSRLSPGGTTTRGRVSRSPSPAPSAPAQSQSQQASLASRSLPQPSATVPVISGSGSTNSSSKLKRAFAGRRKKSEDATTLFGTSGASSASLAQQQTKAKPESYTGNTSANAAHKPMAVQLLGPSATTDPSTHLKGQTSRTFDRSPVAEASRSAVTTVGPVAEDAKASLLAPPSTETSPDLGVGSGRSVNRTSIIQLSPGITSAVNYMRSMVLAEEEWEGRSGVGLDAVDSRSDKEKLDQEEGRKKSEDKGVDDGGKTDEQRVELVQQQVRGQPPVLSCTTMATATTSLGPPSPLSPSNVSAMSWQEKELESREQEQDRGDQKEVWRKSDSTIGHHTIRNAGSNGTRTRPVSLAESFQSAYTVVPSGGPGSVGGNKRWSTVTGELDFQVMMEDPAEEEEGVDSNANASTSSGSQLRRPGSIRGHSAKNINRRSMSLNVGISSSAKPAITPAYVSVTSASHRTADMEAQPLSFSVSEGHASTGHSKPTATVPGVSSPSSPSQSLSSSQSRALSPQPSFGPSASGAHIPSQSISGAPFQQDHRYQRHQHSGSVPLNVPAGRGQPPWNATSSSASPFSSTGLNPKLPPPSMSALQGSSSSSAPISFRQTAISMSNGFAKRAAEKIGGIGKKWGLSTSSSGSGYSSTSSSNRDHGAQSSSFSSSQSHLEQGVPLARTHSNNSSLASSMKSAASLSSGITSGLIHHVHLPGRDKHKDRAKEDKKKNRRTPNAPSGAYSVASSMASTSTSDSDGFSITGAVLGRLVRGPVMWNGTPVKGGMVFGKDLKAVVNQTKAIPVLSDEQDPPNWQERGRDELVKELEHRMLPALVVRCAQHILIWGIQEEGLFRVSGRASHITKLRSEFDTGVDYDLTDCAPGDLDPHAVASVFKAYLRELPEPILTSRLHRAFEAALSQELATYPSQLTSTKITTRPTPGLPSGPKGGFNTALRKPPSLSTLAMPSFNGMPSASNTLIHHLKTLIAQLPTENRDLMRTVVELIRATAKASKETKMPLSNLLLVFCPSLNMSPPLLKALCEADGIWDDPSQPEEVLHIKRHTVLEISMDRSRSGSDRDEDEYVDASDGTDVEGQSLRSVDHLGSGYNASTENSMLEEIPPSSSKTERFDRQAAPTLYLDSHCSSSSLSSSQSDIERRDALSPPLLSSESVDSLLTPVSSGHPSLSHLPLPELKKEPLIKKASARDLKANISHPIPIDTGLVQFPPSPPTPQKRRSIPILSLPSFSSSSHHDGAENTAPELRGKKPSLRRLFTKRSMASIGSGSSGSKHRVSVFNSSDLLDSPHYTPQSASDSSVSTPLSAVTAPQSSTSLPPVLDTPIEGGSSLSLAFGIETTPPTTASPDIDTATTDGTFFVSARSSQFSLGPPTGSSKGADIGHDGPYRQRLDSCVSVASSNHLGLLDDHDREDDWTQSVLIAAGAQ